MFKKFFGKKKDKNIIEEGISKILEETEAAEKEELEAEKDEDISKEPESESFEDNMPKEEFAEEKEPETETEENFDIEKKTEEICEEKIIEESADEVIETQAEEIAAEKEEKQGFFTRLKEGLTRTRGAITERIDAVFSSFKTIDDDLYDELEEVLIMADIGTATSAYILDELKVRAKQQGIKEAEELKSVLKQIITEILEGTNNEIKLDAKPAVILIIGVNGVGKTTSIGKIASMYQKMGKKVVLAAADTFRAAAIDQLEIWAKRANVDIVKHQEGSDPSSVVFDAIASAKAKNADIVICDTAGRLHNKKPLMEELKKIARIVEKQTGSDDFESLLVLDASTGQNALIQAQEFASVAKITGVILTKLDGTAKGGVVIPLAKEQNIGVKFIGVGEQINDLRPFNPTEFAQALFGDE